MTAFCAFLQQHKKAFNEINFLKEENVEIVREKLKWDKCSKTFFRHDGQTEKSL